MTTDDNINDTTDGSTTYGHIFTVLHHLSISDPEMITYTVDEDGEFEFEIDYDFFMQMLKEPKDE